LLVLLYQTGSLILNRERLPVIFAVSDKNKGKSRFLANNDNKTSLRHLNNEGEMSDG
jgi:hypothetical protein